MTKTQKVKFSAKCAESVLHIFEEKYPEEKRLKDGLEYLKTIESFGNLTAKETEEITKYRNDLDVSYAVAYAASYAADVVAAAWSNVASISVDNSYHSACASVYAAIHYAAINASTYSFDASAAKTQEEKCFDFVLDVFKGE